MLMCSASLGWRQVEVCDGAAGWWSRVDVHTGLGYSLTVHDVCVLQCVVMVTASLSVCLSDPEHRDLLCGPHLHINEALRSRRLAALRDVR